MKYDNTISEKRFSKSEVSYNGCSCISHKVNASWKLLESTARYHRFAAKERGIKVALKIENELLDGIFFKLSDRNQGKSCNVQKRIFRRIVEKRQAQANHRRFGRSDDLQAAYYTSLSTRNCLARVDKRRHAA